MTDEERQILGETLEAIVSDIRKNLADTGTNASGRTSDSLEAVLTDDGGYILGRQYFQGVEQGRPAGPVPFDFVHIIRQWMRDKHITAPAIKYKRKESDRWHPKYTPEERGAMAMAGAIAYRIRTQGTRLYLNGGRTDIYTNVLESRLAELQEKLSITITKYI